MTDTHVSHSPRGRSGELTPAQHAFIRQQLVLIPVYIWIVYAWTIFFAHLPIAPFSDTKFLFRDFVHFYAQGLITREHDAHALYDIDAMSAVVERFMNAPAEAKFPPVYGPQVGLLFAPLTLLPYVPAMMLWLTLTIIGYLVCVYLVWRSLPELREFRWMTATLALGAVGLHFTLSFAQVSLIGLTCFTALWLALQRGRLFVAGIAIGALAYKPQLGIVAAFVFVFSREWRVVWGAVTAIVVQAVAAWLYWGSRVFEAYYVALTRLPAVIDGMEPDKSLMHSWRSMLMYTGLPPNWALWATIGFSIVTIAVAIACWRAKQPLAPRYVLLVLATLLVNPHLFIYDLLSMVPALLVAWAWSKRIDCQPARELNIPQALTAFVYIAPVATIALPSLSVQWSVVGFLLLGGYIGARMLRHASVF